MAKVGAVILAAGLSRRMGENKLLLPLGDGTVMGRFLERLPVSLFERVVVVYSDQRVGEIVQRFPVCLCRNDMPEAGKSRSIRLGLEACGARDGIMFFVADQPLLKQTTIRKLVQAFRSNQRCITLPEVNGTCRNPVIFPADCLAELSRLQGDEGGRQVIRKHLDRLCPVPFNDEEEFCDIDTPAWYQRTVAQWR